MPGAYKFTGRAAGRHFADFATIPTEQHPAWLESLDLDEALAEANLVLNS